MSLRGNGVPHTIGKLSLSPTTLLWTSRQSKVCMQSYGGPKLWETQFWKFQDSNLGVLGQNDIWVLVPWLGTKNVIRGKVVASTSPGRDESCESMFARGLSMHQKCFNYALTNLLFGLCRSVWIIDLLDILFSPYLRAPTHPSTLEVLWVKERAPTPYPSIVFTFRLVVESTKEFGKGRIK
jgi:hypothetical protein